MVVARDGGDDPPHAGHGAEVVQRVGHEPLVGEEVVPRREPVVQDQRAPSSSTSAYVFATLWLLAHRCGRTCVSGWSTVLGQLVQSAVAPDLREQSGSCGRFAASARRARRTVVDRRAVRRQEPAEAATRERRGGMERRPDRVGHPVLPLEVVERSGPGRGPR